MKFEHQQYQEQCVNNIISVLENYDFENYEVKELKENLDKFYLNNNSIPNKLKKISNKFKKLDVMMETGTGKTFVYLKTIFELNKKFFLNKFIIFVPRKAIREGVLQNIDLTKEFFYSDDNYKKYIETYIYDGNMSSVSGFVRNKNELSVLILTNSSIDKEKNNLRKKDSDLFYNSSMLEEIVKTNPVIILDEPHLLKGDKFSEIFFETFKKNLHIRFGATFPKDKESELSNTIYVLDSITSFQKYLVKGIQVNTISTYSDNFQILDINSKNKEVKIAYVKNDIDYKNTLKIDEDIGLKIGLNQYKGIYIKNMKKDTLYFSNNTEKRIENDYFLTNEEIELMISKTIEIHFEKEEELFDKGIKELSLFFIPNIADFRSENPRVKTIFEKKYLEIRKIFYDKTKNKEYKKYLDEDFKGNKLAVVDGYFSGDKGSKDDKETDGVDKILRQKETLLSFNEPLRFIFSVWALQEGWDNPNIFNICKLTNKNSDISRRQQVGRGLRLCVNQRGQRITFDYLKQDDIDFYKINTLDIIVSGYEKNFIEEIQKEIIDNSYCICDNYLEREIFERLDFNDREINKLFNLFEDNKVIRFIKFENKYKINEKKSLNEFIKNNKELFGFINEEKYNLLIEKTNINLDKVIKNVNKTKQKVNIRENKLQEFKELWENINRKSKIVYKDLNEEELIEKISKKFNKENIDKIKIKYEVKKYNSKNNEIEKVEIENLDNIVFFKDNKYQEFIEYFMRQYTYCFIINLFNKLNIIKIQENPKKSKDVLNTIIKEEIHTNIINKIDYDISETFIDNTLRNKNGDYKMSLFYTELGSNILNRETKDNYLFDKAVYDSEIEKEVIINDYNSVNNSKIIVFAKLPKIKIPTPYKEYNPDFAYLIEQENHKKLFLIVETKGYESEKDIPSDEEQKIKYAKKFFEKLQEKLPDMEIKYKTRVNKQELISLINNKI